MSNKASKVFKLLSVAGLVTVARGANLGISPLVNFSSQGVYATPQESRAYGVRLRYGF